MYLLVSQLFQAFLTPIASGGHVTSYDTGKFLGLWILPALRFFDKWDDVLNVLASFPQVAECEKNLWNIIKSHYTTLLTSVSFLFNENVRENKTDFGQSWARADLKIWKGKYVHCTRILSGIMKVTKRQSRNNEFQLLLEEVDSHGRYAMFIPYISTVYMKMGIKRKCTGIC